MIVKGGETGPHWFVQIFNKLILAFWGKFGVSNSIMNIRQGRDQFEYTWEQFNYGLKLQLYSMLFCRDQNSNRLKYSWPYDRCQKLLAGNFGAGGTFISCVLRASNNTHVYVSRLKGKKVVSAECWKNGKGGGKSTFLTFSLFAFPPHPRKHFLYSRGCMENIYLYTISI